MTFFPAKTWGGSGSGTVTSVSVVSANGLAGTVATATTTPAITISTSVTGILKGNGTAISSATAGTDYSAGTSALSTGILKSTTTTGALTIAVAGDFPTLNQDTSGTAAKATNLKGGNNTTLLGTIPYQSNTDTTTLLAPNTSATKNFLTQTGTGTNGAAPVWGTIAQADVSGLTTASSPTFTGATLSGITLGSVLFAGTSGVVSQDNANFFYDATNHRIGLAGVTSPLETIHISTSGATGKIRFGDSFTFCGSSGAARIIALQASKNFEIYASTGGTAKTTIGMDTAVLTLGVASTTTGSIVLPNAGNANTVTLQSGTTSGSYTLTLPTAVASAGQVLTDAAGNGVLSWTTAGFAWGASIASTSGTGVTATISNSSSASTVAYSGVIGDTQTNVCTVAQLNTGASSVGHKGMLITCANASGNAIGLEISTSTTGTGRGLYVHSTGTQSNAPLVQIVNAGSGAVTGNSVLLDVAANNGFNPSSGNESHAIEVAGQLANVYNMWYIWGVRNSTNTLFEAPIYNYTFAWVADTRVSNANTALLVLSTLDNTASRNRPIYYMYSREAINANMTSLARTTELHWLETNRTNTATTGTITDSFNNTTITDTSVQNGAWGTLVSSGAVLNLVSVATQTAGTLTHTKNVASFTQSSSATTGKLLTGVVGATERFKVHPMVADGSTAVGYLLDTTTSLATGGAKVLKVANAGTEVFSVDKSGFIFETVGGAVASASTITPTGSVFHVTGTTTISTINPPYTGFTGCITIIPDGIFLTNTSGNIAIASTSVVSKAICFTYDGTKWYPTY